MPEIEFKMLKISNDNSETPRSEMKRLVRRIAGACAPGEKVEASIERVVRRMNAGGALGRYSVSYRTVYGYWHAAHDDESDVKSKHMDRARHLADDIPLQALIEQHTLIAQAVNDNLDRLPRACHAYQLDFPWSVG